MCLKFNAGSFHSTFTTPEIDHLRFRPKLSHMLLTHRRKPSELRIFPVSARPLRPASQGQAEFSVRERWGRGTRAQVSIRAFYEVWLRVCGRALAESVGCGRHPAGPACQPACRSDHAGWLPRVSVPSAPFHLLSALPSPLASPASP
jgi:hypothetical protein